MSRIPLRLRVTVGFAATMAAILIAAGIFLHVRLGSDLDEAIDTALRTRAVEVSALVEEAGADGLSSARDQALIEQDETVAEILARDGTVLDSTAQLDGHPLLSPDQVATVTEEARLFEVGAVPGLEGRARILAVPVETPGGAEVVLVGASLADRDEALAGLRRVFLIGGPVALLIACLAGYWLAGIALRPVEAMRRRASEISSADLGERLPLPRADDELRHLGETLNEMLARLEAGLERERRFVDDASHELRTPLALQKAELELALRGDGDAVELRAAIASAIEEVDRMIGLAEALLVVARSGEEATLHLEPLSAEELLDTVAARFEARANAAGRAIEVVPDAPAALTGDRTRLEQALAGLVENALRHGAGKVALSARANGGTIELHVADEGPGFPGGFAEHAFERFSRADAARSRGGFGLGLAIAASIASSHGGEAGLANRAEGGADVWLAIPA